MFVLYQMGGLLGRDLEVWGLRGGEVGLRERMCRGCDGELFLGFSPVHRLPISMYLREHIASPRGEDGSSHLNYTRQHLLFHRNCNNMCYHYAL